jgi:chromosome segregation ATPase
MSPDRKSADAVVASFEKQREDMASEIGFLRSECDRLHDLLRRAENTISDLKSQAGGHLDVSSHSHVSDARKQESFRAAQHRLEEKQQRLYDREQRLKSEIARWEAAVSSSQAAAKELQIELDAARLELDV